MTKTQPEPAHYILFTSNMRTFERMIPADEIIRILLDSGYWLLGSRTRNRKRIKAGDKAIFYAAGSSLFVATAEITSDCSPVTRLNRRAVDKKIMEELSFEYPDLLSLQVTNPFFFEKPVPARGLIGKLSFIKNHKRWGGYFQGGSIGITKDDLDLILTEGYGKRH